MDRKANHFDNVTLLITHYNRSKSLERLLDHFSRTNSSFHEIVVSDDGSQKEHLDYIEVLKNRYDITLITTATNRGLGHNINKGQDAVKTAYTLYVQEDFVPLEPFDEHFQHAVSFLEDDKSLDIVRFYAYQKFPKTKPYKYGFSKMIFDPWSGNVNKSTMYSDHPHLRRSSFFNKFGRYSEMKNPEKTEYDMMISFLQNKGCGLLFDAYKSTFDQVNTSIEPSTMKRKFWRYSDNFFIKQALYIYRIAKFNYCYYLKKY